jgi:hypothetical protein
VRERYLCAFVAMLKDCCNHKKPPATKQAIA